MQENEIKIGLSGKRLKAAELLANPEIAMKKTEIAESVDIAYSTLWRWLQDPEFIAGVNKLVEIYTNAELPFAWKCLLARMPSDTAAIKLFFEMKGKYAQKVEATVMESPFSGLTKEQLEKLADGNSG